MITFSIKYLGCEREVDLDFLCRKQENSKMTVTNTAVIMKNIPIIRPQMTAEESLLLSLEGSDWTQSSANSDCVSTGQVGSTLSTTPATVSDGPPLTQAITILVMLSAENCSG